ncbi:MAG: metal-dependent transcriptional regulator [Deltaproteobacteria bacterium]|nr:metal-dependent transcriptional regulator [Deltaproteobacteria bacterium]
MSQQNTWKSFDENQLTHSAAHYLMTIQELIKEQGYARVTDIAKAMNITRGSCSISLKPLKKRGLVTEDHNKFLRLSDEGKRLAQLIEKNDELLETLFRDFLGVSPDQAEIDACKLEHLISIETSIKLSHFISFIQQNRPALDAFLLEMRKHPACSTLTPQYLLPSSKKGVAKWN